MEKGNKPNIRKKLILSIAAILIVLLAVVFFVYKNGSDKSVVDVKKPPKVSSEVKKNIPNDKKYLDSKFKKLSEINKEVIGYIYAPNTNLDEPIVQTKDNSTYLDKTFEGENIPFMGTIFMDTDNSKKFTDKLTWLFGHARGSKVPDSRMFNDVNYYDEQKFFDEHPYIVVETPEKKHYYEAAFLIIVPEDTAFYKVKFDSNADFKKQLTDVSRLAHTKNKNVKIDVDDKYMVLSTCRVNDDTIRANLYCREIKDSELPKFLEDNSDKLVYKATR